MWLVIPLGAGTRRAVVDYQSMCPAGRYELESVSTYHRVQGCAILLECTGTGHRRMFHLPLLRDTEVQRPALHQEATHAW